MIGGAGNLGMGIAFTLYDQFSNTAGEIENSMNSLGMSTDRAVDSMNNAMNRMKIGAGLMAAGGGILAGAFKASEVRAEFQAYEVQFETLLQSQARGLAFMNQIKQDALDNPIFGTKSLVASNAAITATGTIMEEQSRRVTNNLANILAGVGKGDGELIRMAANLNGIASLGKATGQDIKQFIFAGIPIFKILSEGLGITMEEASKMEVSFNDLDKAFAKVSASGGSFSGATERMAQSTKGLKAALEDGVELTLERIGYAIEPLTRKIYTGLGEIIGKFKEWIETPIGQSVARFVVILGAGLVVMGAFLLISGAAKFSVFMLAKTFNQNTQAQIVNQLVTKGTAAGLRAMAVAIWQAIAPALLIVAVIALFAYVGYKAWEMIDSGNTRLQALGTYLLFVLGPIGWLIASVLWLKKGFDLWHESMDEAFQSDTLGLFVQNMSGVEKIFASIWGIFSAFKEIWDSWDGENFTLTEATEEKLKALGILDFVLTASTYIVRFKEFLKGVWESIKENFNGVWESIKESFHIIWEGIKPVIASLFKALKPIMQAFGMDVGKMTGDVNDFKEMGKMVGNIIVLVFHSIAAAIRVVAVTIAALAPLVEALIPVFVVTANFLGFVGKMFYAAFRIGMTMVALIWDMFVGWLSFLYELPTEVFKIGVDIVTALWDGMKSMWEGFTNWLNVATFGISGTMTDGIKSALGVGDANYAMAAGGYAGGTTGAFLSPTVGNGARPQYNPITSKNPLLTNAGGAILGGNGGNQQNIFQIQIDGDDIAHRVNEKTEMKNARK